MVPRSPEPLGGRVSADFVQGELLPGQKQPDVLQWLLPFPQVKKKNKNNSTEPLKITFIHTFTDGLKPERLECMKRF